jgi:outer membrane protein assembly factor BamD (BamD/ComL family)
MPDRSSANASEESQLVSSTRSLLRAGNAAAALQLLEHSASRFHPGILIQEREALCVEALAALGRTSEASAHAEAFIRAYPKSPYASRVRSRVSDVTGNTY